MKIAFFCIIIPLILLSFLMSKKNRAAGRDFFVPKSGLPYVVVALTMAASQFGSSMLIGGVQQAHQQSIGQGFWPAIYTLLAASASCFLNILIAPRFKQFGDSVTPPDFIEIRYGRSRFMRSYHSIVYICSVSAVLVSQFVGFAAMGVVAGFSYKFSIILCAFVVLLLSLGSGMRGVAWTDAIQYIFIALLLLFSIPFSVKALGMGGFRVADLLHEEFFPTPELKDKFLYTFMPVLIGNMFNYEYFMRFMSCKDMREAKWASGTAGVVLLVTALPIALLGSVANYFFQGADSAEVFSLILNAYMPKPMVVLMMLAVLMAVLTSADTMLISLSSMVSKDLYAGVLCRNRPVTELKYFNRIAKLSIVFFALVATIFALYFDEILKISFFFSPLTSGVMFAPMIVGLLWKGASRTGAVCAICVSAVLAVFYLTGVVTVLDRVTGPALAGTISIVVFSWLFPNKELKKE